MKQLSRFLTSLPLIITITLGMSGCDTNETNSQSNARHLISAQSYHNQHQYRAALLETRNALKVSPSDDAAELYAQIFLDIGQPKTAAEFIESYGARSFELSALLVRAYLDLGKYISAEKTLKNFNSEELPNNEGKVLLAEALAGQNNYKQANELLSTVLSTDPTHLNALLLTLQIASIQQNPVAAQQAIIELKKHHSESPKALVVLARTATARKDYNEAEQLLMQSLRFVPDSDIMTPARASTLLLLIETLTNQGRYADAAPYSNALANANPNWQETQDRMANAIANLQSGDLEAAEKILMQIQQDNPNQGRSAALLGIINLQKGDSEKASEYFADNIDPETAAPIFTGAAALAQLQQNQIDSALQMLETALEANPDNKRLLVLYGLAATRTQDLYQKGIEALQQAASQGEPDYRMHTTLADGYFNGKEIAKATAELEKAQAIAPDNIALRYHIAKRYLANGLIDNAKAFAQAQLKKDEKDAHNWIIQGLVASIDKNIDLANESFKKALSIDSKSYTANLYQALIAANQQNWKLATQGFTNAIASNPIQLAPYGGLLKSLAATESPNDVVTRFEALTGKNGDKTNAALIATDYLIQQNKTAEAQNKFETINLAELKEQRSQASAVAEEIYINLIKLHVRDAANANDQKAAVAYLEQAQAQYPNNTKLLSLAAAYYLQYDKLAEAAALASKLRQLNENVYSTLISADILIKQNDYAQAISSLKSEWKREPNQDIALAIQKAALASNTDLDEDFLQSWEVAFPNQVQPHFYRANKAQQSGDIVLALKHYEKIIEINPSNVGALNNAAWFYFESDKLKRADELATKAVALAPNSAAVLDTAGWIKYNLNQAEAVELLKKAAELAPDNQEITTHYNTAKLHFNQ
ncbi:tetratricopeptide repeat protein [Saccharophagus degradans]|uniref:Tetratricopeptide TPR_2 n=1 Tax=Saccharophagus degradans (strain 2-40 / ATCC 43961 / DSM 17024) TaxID=203122 RepID=Q21PD7_SACD2|nr:tetratricopeptide repeat protein [Saccharophagus degradans]ABD79442.1 Tetratricopeptide TPR_2 [Saccharophagus degradans 2-40]